MAITPILRFLYLYGAIAFPTGVNAEPLDGIQLYSTCKSEGIVETSFCVGYIIGAVEGLKYGAFMAANRINEDEPADTAYLDGFANFFLGYCIPHNANNQQVSDVVITYLRNNPSNRHNSARALISEAFRNAFPCE